MATTNQLDEFRFLMTLTNQERRWLKKQAHHRKPVVLLGQNGLTDSVLREIQVALNHHELVKLKVSAGDRDERDQVIESITRATGAELIQRVGHTATVYRHNPDKSQPLIATMTREI